MKGMKARNGDGTKRRGTESRVTNRESSSFPSASIAGTNSRARVSSRERNQTCLRSVTQTGRNAKRATSLPESRPRLGAPQFRSLSVDEGRRRATIGTTENRRRNDSSRRRRTSRDTEIDIIDVTRLQRTSSWTTRRNLERKRRRDDPSSGSADSKEQYEGMPHTYRYEALDQVCSRTGGRRISFSLSFSRHRRGRATPQIFTLKETRENATSLPLRIRARKMRAAAAAAAAAASPGRVEGAFAREYYPPPRPELDGEKSRTVMKYCYRTLRSAFALSLSLSSSSLLLSSVLSATDRSRARSDL